MLKSWVSVLSIWGLRAVQRMAFELRVHLTLIPAEELIANVNGVKNVVWYKPMLSAQPCTTVQAQAQAELLLRVVADVIDIVRDISYTEDGAGTIPQLAFEALTIPPI